MKITRSIFMVVCLVTAFLLLAQAQEKKAPPPGEGTHEVYLLTLEGAITPVTAKLINQAIDKAEEKQAEALVIQLNTPGGLVLSTWQITKDILNADVPVIVYVAPSGARAASAGMYITYAAHIAAMASGTNIGAAHPVELQGGKADSTMMEKATNDAVANIKSVATKRHRNEKWAEDAVRKSVSIPEYEALKLKVIDLVADNLSDLLAKCDGRTVELPIGPRTLKTKGAPIRKVAIGPIDRILEVIVDPTIAYILFTIGMLGLYFEFANPGAIVPGVVGGICLILAFYAFQSLPINYAGVLLIVLAMVLFILEVKVPSHGALTIGGIVAMLLGSLLLITTSAPYARISLSVIITTVGSTAAFFIFAVGAGLRAQQLKVTTGWEGMVGATGVAHSRFDPAADGEGQVFVSGEIWRARAAEPIEPNQKVKVTGVENLTLIVTRA